MSWGPHGVGCFSDLGHYNLNLIDRCRAVVHGSKMLSQISSLLRAMTSHFYERPLCIGNTLLEAHIHLAVVLTCLPTFRSKQGQKIHQAASLPKILSIDLSINSAACIVTDQPRWPLHSARPHICQSARRDLHDVLLTQVSVAINAR